MSLSKGTVLQQRYRIVQEVGRGGFGAVYRAWHMALNRPVAVKENLDTSPEAGRQFEREAQLLGNLRHPNLPVVIDHFVLPGQGQYLVMDFVEGKSLETMLIENGGPLPEAKLLPWMEQVCSALTYLHSRQPPIIHRDIKPGNIIIADDRAMLVDFGISKTYDPHRATTVGAKAVTPGLSPLEQYGRGKTDARSDLYALGATMYALLTNQVPPEAPDLASRADVLTPVRKLNPAVSERTAAAVMRAMALHADDRPASVGEFAQALTGPVMPPPPKPQPKPPVAASPTPAAPPVMRNQAQPAAVPRAVAQTPGSEQVSQTGSGYVGCFIALAALLVVPFIIGALAGFFWDFGASIFLLIFATVDAAILYIVGRLNLGLLVARFTDAFAAGAVITTVAFMSFLILQSVGIFFDGVTLWGPYFIMTIVVLLSAGRFTSGIKVRGFIGILVAAIAIAAIAWLVTSIGSVDANPTSLLLQTLF